MATLTLVHVVISLAGIGSGLVVLAAWPEPGAWST
jgi:hypothetical protein